MNYQQYAWPSQNNSYPPQYVANKCHQHDAMCYQNYQASLNRAVHNSALDYKHVPALCVLYHQSKIATSNNPKRKRRPYTMKNKKSPSPEPQSKQVYNDYDEPVGQETKRTPVWFEDRQHPERPMAQTKASIFHSVEQMAQSSAKQ